MKEYKNNACPYCNKQITDSAKVVVCSYCNVAHHEQCWIKNEGCSTVDCSGSAKKIGIKPIAKKTTSQHLLRGHDVNNQNETLYTSEGSKTYVETVMTDPEIMYIDKKAFYYKSKFDRMRTTHSSNSWNWAAALLSPAWLIYRKMYGLGFGLMAATHIAQLLLGDMSVIFSLGLSLLMGIFGNKLYMNQIDKLVDDSVSMSKLETIRDAKKNGGVSVMGILLALVVSFTISYLSLV